MIANRPYDYSHPTGLLEPNYKIKNIISVLYLMAFFKVNNHRTQALLYYIDRTLVTPVMVIRSSCSTISVGRVEKVD